MTTSGIDPSTFRFVAQFLKHCAIAYSTIHKEPYKRVSKGHSSGLEDGSVNLIPQLRLVPSYTVSPNRPISWCLVTYSNGLNFVKYEIVVALTMNTSCGM
jgi:hypothetical protein